MTVESKMRELALDRLQQSEESLEEAEYLFDGNKSPRSVINRAYYAMFYSMFNVGRSTCPQCLWVVLVECPCVSAR